ncbi:hypothetical protein GSI_12359 [Ganoderma sinense ZZ0214-1]|uniref:Uncharacterized protein n=1 Tax=Ganoderma sinense ZZ0214-1 TaxID=1077348 RepID=A0A2G8RYK8_9APHY|nr:hypothetical protein GSI_12359 [Ganoderma sinense ZZ0214-1]
MPLPAGVMRVMYCRTVSIIPAELLPSEPNEDFMWGILRRFCGIQDSATLAQQMHGPANVLFVHRGAATAFNRFSWWLLPTEIPDRYEIKNPDPVFNIGSGVPTPSHVTFADHSASALALGVDLPDRTLLRRIHAALAEVFHRSGARNTFVAQSSAMGFFFASQLDGTAGVIVPSLGGSTRVWAGYQGLNLNSGQELELL